MRSSCLLASLLLLLSMPGVAATPRLAAPPPARRLPAPEHVTSQARQELRSRMGQHAMSMQNLVRGVVLLDRPTVSLLADRIADEEVFARKDTVPEREHSALPPRVFTEGEALSAAARELAAAAAEGSDDVVLGERFAALTRTCVTCHSAYLHDQVEPRPFDERPKNGGARSPDPGAH